MKRKLSTEIIRSYILELLSPNEIKEIKEQVETDGDLFTRVDCLKSELIRDFLLSKLDHETREQFIKLLEKDDTLVEETYLIKTLLEAKEQRYTYEELLGFFKPSEGPQLAVMRSGKFEVLKPEEGVDSKGSLEFELKDALEGNIRVAIFDNKNKVVYKETVTSNQVSFSIKVEDLHPGRYYWQLSNNEGGVVLGLFFVQKELEPL